MTRLFFVAAVLSAFLAALCTCASGQAASDAFPIKHLIVMMLENRAFDHRIGWFKQSLNMTDFDGLDGTEFNLLNGSFGSKCMVDDSADVYDTPNAGHGYDAQFREQYGIEGLLPPPYSSPPMTGFAAQEGSCDVMSSIPVAHSPVSQAFIENFVVFDRWFPSFPGPTEINRMFFHSGTSNGFCDNPELHVYADGFPQESLYHRLETNNISWGVFQSDDVSTALFFRDVRTSDMLSHFHSLTTFKEMAANGTLPLFSLVEPRFFSIPNFPANDEHPSGHSTYSGELLLKSLYDTVRQSPLWEQLALFVTYDEHGGLFDHVPSPVGVPPPSPGLNCTYAGDPLFDHSRLGVRVPAYLVSPWVAKGFVEHTPQPHRDVKHTPKAFSFSAPKQYEHSSMIRSALDLFGLQDQSITDRDAWAASFLHLFSEPTARTDCPSSMPEPLALSLKHSTRMRDEYLQPMNDWQLSLVRGVSAVVGTPMNSRSEMQQQGISREVDGAEFIRNSLAALRSRMNVTS
jgi:phospholipase C